MSNFYIGQEVVCIDDKLVVDNGAIKNGEIYTVLGLRECKCGSISLDIGITHYHNGTECSQCGKVTLTNVGWLNSKRFVPIDYTQNKEITFEQIKKENPVFSN